MQLLLDTNIWMDYYLEQRVGHASAMSLLAYAIDHGHNLAYAVTTSKDVFYLINAGAKRILRKENNGTLSEDQARVASQLAWACLGHMAENAIPIGCDLSDVWLAEKYRNLHTDFEDNLVLAAAQRAGVDLLVTGDVNLIQHSPVAAMNAQDALAYLRGLAA